MSGQRLMQIYNIFKAFINYKLYIIVILYYNLGTYKNYNDIILMSKVGKSLKDIWVEF